MWLSVEVAGNEYQAILDLGTPRVVANKRVQTETGLDDDDLATLRLGDTTLSDVPVFIRELDLGGFTMGGGGFVIVGAQSRTTVRSPSARPTGKCGCVFDEPYVRASSRRPHRQLRHPR